MMMKARVRADCILFFFFFSFLFSPRECKDALFRYMGRHFCSFFWDSCLCFLNENSAICLFGDWGGGIVWGGGGSLLFDFWFWLVGILRGFGDGWG